jgi:membrane associated rhomboid family serine protease
MFPLYDTIPSSRFPIVNYILIFLNIVIFLYQSQLNESELQWFVYHFGLVPARFTNHDFELETGLLSNNYSPFFTNMFLHGSWAHLIGNMWTLYIFGDNVEDKMGHFRYLMFYILTGILASVSHFMINPNSTMPAVGASGAISGIMGAYFLLFPHSKIVTMVILFIFVDFIPIPAFVFLLFWFLGQLFSGVISEFVKTFMREYEVGGIAFWAHIGGFLAGILFYKFFIQKIRNKRGDYYDDYEVIG